MKEINKINTFLIIILSLLFLISFQTIKVSALSSDQVVSTIAGNNGVGGYLNSGEAAKTLYSGPINYQGNSYWFVYSYLSSQPNTRNVIFVIDDNSGTIVTDPTLLTPLLTFVYQNDLLTTLQTNSESLQDFQSFLLQAQSTEQSTHANYYQLIRNQIAQQYPQIDFSGLETALTALEKAQTNAISQISSNNAILSQYNSFPTVEDFNSSYTQFNYTLNSLETLSASVDNYHNELFSEAQVVSNLATLNYTDKQTINTALENLYNVGDFVDFKAQVLQPADSTFQTGSQQIPSEVNQSIQASIYRVAAKTAINSATPTFLSTLSGDLSTTSISEYKKCGISYSDLNKQSGAILTIMNNPQNSTIAQLLTVPNLVTLANNDMNVISNSLVTCQQRNATTTNTSSNNGNLTNILIGILVIAIAYVGYGKYKKMKKDSEEENTEKTTF